MSYLWATRFWSTTTLLFLSNVQSLIVQHMGMRFHSHACIFTYTCSWNISTYCLQTHEKNIFWCMQDVPPSSLQAKKFYEFWVYMVKGDHNTSYYYFAWHKCRNTTKWVFFHRFVASYIRTVFLSWKLHQYPCEFIFTVPLFTELAIGKFDGVLLTCGRVYKPMQCICVRACVCGPGGFCHLAERFLQNSHILTWRMLIRGRPSDELGCDG